MRSATASACWKLPRRCSAPAGRTRAWRRWRGGPASASEALYRHFPTREALFEAVYRREVQQLGELAESLKSEPDPGRGLAALAALECRIRGHQEGHVRGAGARGAEFVGTDGLFVRSPDQGGRRPAGSCRRRRRDPLRHQRGGRAAGRWSACATCTTSPTGRRAWCGCSMSSSTACACEPGPAERRRRWHRASAARECQGHGGMHAGSRHLKPEFNPPVSV